MKLFYFDCKKNNFGDVLNPWFWEQQLHFSFDENENEIMVGIGTLINNKIPEVEKVHVFGSGAGYGEYIPQKRNNWHIHCVRGPLTAEALGVQKKLVTSDPVIYLNRLINLSSNKKYKCSFMPHYGIDSLRFKNICKNAGIHYISPSEDRDKVIQDVNDSDKLICSAMHGAILAEALRVPWLAVNTSQEILPFKWHDFCQSLDLEYAPYQLPIIWGDVPDISIKRGIAKTKDYYCTYLLKKLARSNNFKLSKDAVLNNMNDKFEDVVNEFKLIQKSR